jgi:hypothetical protein
MDKSTFLKRSSAACAALLVAALAAAASAQQGEEADGADRKSGPQSCLKQAEIRRAKILSNRTIVFVTRFEEIYNNALPKQCPGLHKNSLVNYPVTSGQLCAGDRFQVLWEQQPGSYLPTALCPLGMFVPITEAELEDLMAMTDENRTRRPRGRSSREAVTSEQVELPPAEAPAVASEPAPSE